MVESEIIGMSPILGGNLHNEHIRNPEDTGLDVLIEKIFGRSREGDGMVKLAKSVVYGLETDISTILSRERLLEYFIEHQELAGYVGDTALRGRECTSRRTWPTSGTSRNFCGRSFYRISSGFGFKNRKCRGNSA